MKMKLLVVWLCMFVCVNFTYAQISTKEKPIGLKLNVKSIKPKETTRKVLSEPNITSLIEEDKQEVETGIPPRFGYRQKVNFNLSNSGEWTILNNGDKLWRLNISSPNALSINLLYDKFWIPKGGKLFVYSKNGKQSIGGFTSISNNGKEKDVQGFATGLIYDDDIIVEYWQPAHVTEEAVISIEYVVHGYRYININNKSLSDCQVNINCSEGQNWQKEKEAVALILVNGNRYCSGSLVNTTAEDLRPLFLTADHCLGGWANSVKYDSEGNSSLNHYSFYWHYEHPTCSNSSTEPPIYSTVGATVKANNSTTDFALLELTQDPRNLPNFTPYYLGWDRSGNAGTGGVGIHHPRGDVKKISIEEDIINQTSYLSNSGNSHWKIVWNTGVTERGSSGSPLLNLDKKIIGQLHGGYSNCNTFYKYGKKFGPNEPDWYGCFHISWTGNGTSNNKRKLQPWLDPMGTGVAVLDGAFAPTLSGPSLVCSQATYNIDNLPTGATVQWSASNSNLQLISGQGTKSATFRKNGNGECIITATIGSGAITKKVWSGVPKILSQSRWYLLPDIGRDAFDVYKEHSECIEKNTKKAIEKSGTATIFEWRRKKGSFSYIRDGNEIYFYGINSRGVSVEVRAQNKCGWSAWEQHDFSVMDKCGNGDYYYTFNYFLSPNGDGLNDTWEISLASKYLKDASLSSKQTVLKSLGYNVAIFNSQGAMVYQKENYMQDPERFSGVGNTGNYRGIALPDGTYFYTITGSIVNSGYIYLKR